MFLFSKARLKIIWILITVITSLLIVTSSFVYFLNVPTPIFLLEKGELRFDPLWRTAFYFHVISSCICLLTGPLLMIPKLIGFRRFHAVLGYGYLNAVLWIAAPTGLMISFSAKGGLLSAIGFAITGILWWISTWLGYRTIRANQLNAHICWMVRSYSIALSAIAFRLIQQVLSIGLDNETNYITSVCLSLVVSLWISETCIARQFRNKSTPSWFSIFSYQLRGTKDESLPGIAARS